MNMNQGDTKKRGRLRGFTLLEMVVVIGIIAILLAISVPAMAGYITRSRLNTANSNAKVLFNSLQTICQEYEFADRSQANSSFYGMKQTGQMLITSANGTDNLTVTVRGGDFTGGLATPEAAMNGTTASSFRNRLGRLYQENNEVYWIAVIENYQVRSTFCATTGTTEYIGAYKNKMEDREGLGDGIVLGDLANPGEASNLVLLQNYVNNAWGGSFAFSAS